MIETQTSRIEIVPHDAALGASVSGVDLRDPLDDEALALIRAALAEHQVLFFRNQDLSAEEHLAFGAQFGELFHHFGTNFMSR